MNLHALVIVADAEERGVVRNTLYKQQWEVCEAPSVEEASRIIDRFSWNLIICDAALCMRRTGPPGGLTLLSELKSRFGSKAQIVITAVAQESTISPLEAILNGASDYILKPSREEKIAECSRRVIERLRAAEREAKEAHLASRLRAPDSPPVLPKLVGESDAIIGVFRKLAQIVENIYLDGLGETSTPARLPSIFITGETGTGKELAAHLIHRHGSQSKGEFVPVNCSNLSSELAESELFGHEPGAFTGAGRERRGLWEVADGGTLFLDEITEAPASVLPKLLRVLQDGMVKRLGSNKWRRTNVQVIAASNRDMQKEISEGRFRSDLYHRLSLHRLHLPPLRERLEDVPLIVEHFARRHFTREVRFAQDALDVLMTLPFSGNVRELENIVQGAARKSPDGVVYAIDLMAYLEMVGNRAAVGKERVNESPKSVQQKSGSTEGLEEQVRRFKLQVVRETLARCNGNISRAAHELKISRPSLYRLIKEVEAERDSCPYAKTERDLLAGGVTRMSPLSAEIRL